MNIEQGKPIVLTDSTGVKRTVFPVSYTVTLSELSLIVEPYPVNETYEYISYPELESNNGKA